MNWQTLTSRMMELAGMQNIPDIHTYAKRWARLAEDFEEIGLKDTAANCRSRAAQYLDYAPGEYVKLIEQPIAELILVGAEQ
jgi:hypothetical protein